MAELITQTSGHKSFEPSWNVLSQVHMILFVVITISELYNKIKQFASYTRNN